LDNFKTYILSSLGSQLDTLKIKQKQEVENVALSVYCPKCRKKHPLREFPLDNIEVCGICADNHATEKCPSLPGLKETYQENQDTTEQLCFVAAKRPWQPRNPGTFQDPSQQFNPYFSQQYPQQNWTTPMPWKAMAPQQVQNQPWQQSWRGTTYGSMPAQPYPMQQQYSPYPTPNQYPPQFQQPYPNQPAQPQISQPQQLQFPSNQPPRPTQLPAQPIANPNNKVAQPAYNVELQNFPAYMITSLGINDIHLRSGKVLNNDAPVIVEEPTEEVTPNLINNNDATNPISQTSSSLVDHTKQSSTPPFPERLALEKKIIPTCYDLLDELKNVCIKIPLLQAIKDIPIYAKK
jgi:hypothetical protein